MLLINTWQWSSSNNFWGSYLKPFTYFILFSYIALQISVSYSYLKSEGENGGDFLIKYFWKILYFKIKLLNFYQVSKFVSFFACFMDFFFYEFKQKTCLVLLFLEWVLSLMLCTYQPVEITIVYICIFCRYVYLLV